MTEVRYLYGYGSTHAASVMVPGDTLCNLRIPKGDILGPHTGPVDCPDCIKIIRSLGGVFFKSKPTQNDEEEES